MSGQKTDQNYRVLEFDDLVFKPNDFNNDINSDTSLMVQPFDIYSGFRDFGFEKVGDIFTKITYNPTNTIRTNFSYWNVDAHRKRFDPSYLYWYEGQNELFRNTKRWYFEFNHSLSQKTFYNVRMAHFKQDQFQGVRWFDSDEDGYPNWFEWRHPAGGRSFSDPYNSDIVPHYVDQGQVVYIQRDDKSGWYYGAEPGNYDWTNAESFTDGNNNVVIGPNSDASSASAENQIVIGYGATGHGDNIAVIGNGSATAIHPHDNNEVDLGSTSYKYKNLFLTGSPIVGVSNAITSSATFNGSELIIPVNTSSGNITLTIDTDQCIKGRMLMIKKINNGGSTLTIATEGSETLNGGTTWASATLVVGSQVGTGVILFSDGSNWYDFAME